MKGPDPGHTENSVPKEAAEKPQGDGPYGGRQAAVLRPYIGKWVAMSSPTRVLVAGDKPEDVLAWLATHDRRAAFGMFRVPASDAEAIGAAPL